MLDQKSFDALRLPPLPPVGAIRFAADFSPEEIGQSAVARNALILLHSASVGLGLKLTTTGNLARSVVAEMCDLFTWPGFDKTEAFQFHKVINEPDFLPLYFVRHLVETAGLVRQRKGYLKTTPAGRQVLEDPARQALQALLFHLALWEIDLGYFGRGLHREWPQRDIGVLLWSLSVAANGWESSKRLTRMCTIPINGVLEAQWDTGTMATEARILRRYGGLDFLNIGKKSVAGRRFRHLASTAGRRHGSVPVLQSKCRTNGRRVIDVARFPIAILFKPASLGEHSAARLDHAQAQFLDFSFHAYQRMAPTGCWRRAKKGKPISGL